MTKPAQHVLDPSIHVIASVLSGILFGIVAHIAASFISPSIPQEAYVRHVVILVGSMVTSSCTYLTILIIAEIRESKKDVLEKIRDLCGKDLYEEEGQE